MNDDWHDGADGGRGDRTPTGYRTGLTHSPQGTAASGTVGAVGIWRRPGIEPLSPLAEPARRACSGTSRAKTNGDGP